MPKRNNPNASYFIQMRRAEKRIIGQTLETAEAGGKIRAAANLLGVTNSFLRSRMKIVGLLPDAPPAKPAPSTSTDEPASVGVEAGPHPGGSDGSEVR